MGGAGPLERAHWNAIMSEVLDILLPTYVLRNALYGGILTGLLLPLVGLFMYVRRMVFLSVTLPQLSAGGIAAAFFWHYTFHQGFAPHSDFVPALMGSTLVTTVTLVVLAWMEQRSRRPVEGRIGVLFVLAGAVTILLLASERIPEAGVIHLLRGEIIAISDVDLTVLVICFVAIAASLWLFRKELVLVSVDRDLAITLGKRVWVWDVLLYGLVGTAISLGVLMVGPLVTFGFLLLPPLIAVRMGHRAQTVPFTAAGLGAFIAFFGFIGSYLLDWPTGATDALLACAVLFVFTLGQRIFAGRPVSM